jgi:hypothetical protein
MARLFVRLIGASGSTKIVAPVPATEYAESPYKFTEIIFTNTPS